MGLSKKYFMELREQFMEKEKMVESVKLGDVMYTIESRKSGLEELIDMQENEIVKFKNDGIDHMVNYCQSCIEKYQFAIEQLDSVYGIIKLYK